MLCHNYGRCVVSLPHLVASHAADVIEELEREWTEFGGSNSVMSTEHEDYSSRTHSHTNSHESPSVPRKPPSGYNRLENQINLRHLVKLMKIFHVRV